MTSVHRAAVHAAGSFAHQAAIHDSDERFLAVALPFVRDGLAQGDPVMVTTTPANLELLADALGRDGRLVDYAETAFLGRRTVERATAFHRYWQRRGPEAPRGGHVRILAEPVWTGRAPADVRAWQRMEAALNLLLRGTNIWMICPYDARTAASGVLAAARRTHPWLCEDGAVAVPCPEYADPAAFIAECDAVPLPQPPADSAVARVETLHALRTFVSGQASFLGLNRDRAALLAVAAHEVAAALGPPVTVRLWERLGAIVCQLDRRGGRICDPVAGLRPPGSPAGPAAAFSAGPSAPSAASGTGPAGSATGAVAGSAIGPAADSGDGMWIARQLCDRLDIHHDLGGCVVQLRVPSARAEESRQSRKY
ncbi:anti-sigma factor RsbA family regulatory protein [Streptosporangium sp. NPDC050855]|uniref:anti-sigma factor RsbA family regulatory protein n=1 Tax=Streptosporangium sp. NPDC050855 TaxID=3366194 RepID=UPI0037A1EA12